MDISGILNLLQESRLLKTGTDIKPLLTSEETFWLKQGDVLEGAVVKTLPQNRVIITINGRSLTARTDLPLNPGDRIQVEVQTAKGEIVLKVLSRHPSIETLIKQEMKPLLGAFQRPIDKTILNLKATIQSFLASKAFPEEHEISSLLTKLSDLLERINLNPLFSESSQEPSSPESPPLNTSVNLETTTFTPSPEESSPPFKALSLLEWIRDSGIEWENKLKVLVETPPRDLAGTVKALIEHDLKGLSLKILTLLSNLDGEPAPTGPNTGETHMAAVPLTHQESGNEYGPPSPGMSSPSEPPAPSSMNPSHALLSELSSHLEHLSQTIQAHQWVNAIRQNANQQFYFQIPMALSDGTKPLDLFIYKRKPSRKPPTSTLQQDTQDYWVVFFLTLSVLGNLRIDLKTHAKNLTLSIQTETETAEQTISPFLSGLKEALHDVGYQVTGVKVEKVPGGKVRRPDPISNLPLVSQGVVSIVA